MVQPIDTQLFGKLNFVRVYRNQGTKDNPGPTNAIGVLDNGTWVYFPSGQPVADPHAARQLLQCIHRDAVLAFDVWWRAEELSRDHANDEPEARALELVECDDPPGTKLIYRDTGDEVEDAADLHAYWKKASPLKDLAMNIFTERLSHRRDKAVKEQLATPQYMATQKRVASAQQRANLEKARATRMANLAKGKQDAVRKPGPYPGQTEG